MFLGEKLTKAFRSNEFCDVHIQLNDETFIDAHSLVLKLQSGWFKSRLSDNWCDGPVLCTEFKADNVRAVIEYMYSGLIDLTMENGKDVYEVSDYLGVDELSTLCTDFFVRNVNADTVLKVLDIGQTFAIACVTDACLAYLDTYIECVLARHGEQFYNISIDLLLTILGRRSLCIHEEMLFDHVCLWMDGVDDDDKMAVWQRIKPLIKFESMALEYIVRSVMGKGIISNDFAMHLVQYNTNIDRPLIDLPSPRTVCNEQDIVVNRFFRRSTTNTWEENCINGDRLGFKIDHDIYLRGVIVYGNQNCSFCVSVSLYSNDPEPELCQRTKIRYNCNNAVEIVVVFPTAIKIAKEKLYTVVINMTGGKTYYGEGGSSRLSHTLPNGDQLKTEFSNVIGSLTTVETGQLKGIVCRR
ncbi:MAG: BTB/POZ domain-containing protein [Sedimenticola sp.]